MEALELSVRHLPPAEITAVVSGHAPVASAGDADNLYVFLSTARGADARVPVLASIARVLTDDGYALARFTTRGPADDRFAVVAAVTDPADDVEVLEDICASIWLHGRWRALTKPLTTAQKERLADAVDAANARSVDDGDEPLTVDRWWRP